MLFSILYINKKKEISIILLYNLTFKPKKKNKKK